MTTTESVSSDKNTIGAKKVSGLFFRGCVTKVITVTPRMIYAEAQRALIRGFLVIGLIIPNLLPLIDLFRNKIIEIDFSLDETIIYNFEFEFYLMLAGWNDFRTICRLF